MCQKKKKQNNCQETIEWLSQVKICNLKEDSQRHPGQEWTARKHKKRHFYIRDIFKPD